MGHRSRSQFLVPALFSLATTAFACGGTSVGDPNGQDPGVSVGSSGSGPYLSPSGGYGAGGASGGAQAVGGNGGNGLAYFSKCPRDIPVPDSLCVPSADPSSSVCTYTGECTPTYAVCSSAGTWTVYAEAVACVGGAAGFDDGPLPSPPPTQTLPSGQFSCPAATPKTGMPCYLPDTIASYSCDYLHQHSSCTVDTATCGSAKTWSVTNTYLGCAGAGGI